MKQYDNFAKTFSQSRKNMKWWELDAILEDIEKHQFSKILDIGCGSGRFLEFFEKKFWHLPQNYLGIDSSKEMIAEAKKSFSEVNFLISEMQSITQKNLKNSFDAIVLLASFHHLDNENDRMQVLKNLSEILAENGKIYLTNWNLLTQEKYQNSHIWNGDFSMKIGEFYRYYHWFSLDELENLFQKNNFIIEKNEIFENGRNIFSILKNPS